MNEYVIRNGFVESAAAEMLGLAPGVRDYVRTEYNGRGYAIRIVKAKKAKKLKKSHIKRAFKQIVSAHAEPNGP